MKGFVAVALLMVSSACVSTRNSLPVSVFPGFSNVVGVYEFVSLDLSICGKVGTLPVTGEARFYTDTVHFSFIDPVLGKELVEIHSTFVVRNNLINFHEFGKELWGYFQVEKRKDGTYLIINFKLSPAEIKEMEKYPGSQSKEGLEKARAGLDWVFKRK